MLLLEPIMPDTLRKTPLFRFFGAPRGRIGDMTTLIAIQHDDWCLIAGDSQTTFYNLGDDCSPMGKIAQNGKYLIAGAGTVRGMNIAQHNFNPPPPVKKNLDKFMISQFIPALRQAFVKSGYDMKDDGDIAQHDNNFIVAAFGTLYFIDEAYGLERSGNNLYVSGTGMQLALGAAYALGINEVDDWEEACEIAYKAVKAAIKYDIHSGGRVQIALQSKDGKTWIAFAEEED